MLIAFNKPFRVLSQFTPGRCGPRDRSCLKDYLPLPGIYPIGRLDFDSEGLLLLSDRPEWTAHFAHPRNRVGKTYLVQVEGTPGPEALAALRHGVQLNDGPARALGAEAIADPAWLWPRDPPVRFRARIPTTWLRLVLDEGRNRQVRRMTAQVGHPTLRLVRTGIGEIGLQGLLPGQWREIDARPPAQRQLGARVRDRVRA